VQSNKDPTLPHKSRYRGIEQFEKEKSEFLHIKLEYITVDKQHFSLGYCSVFLERGHKVKKHPVDTDNTLE